MKYLLIILLFTSCTVNKYYCLDCKKAEVIKLPHTQFPLLELPKWESHPFYLPYKPFDSCLLNRGISITIDSIRFSSLSDTFFIEKPEHILDVPESTGTTAIGVINFFKPQKKDTNKKGKIKK